MADGIFNLSDSEAEISRLGRSAERRAWTTPDGTIFDLTIPATVYPPREDTDLLCRALRTIGPGKGKRLLEIGCGSGAVSLYAASLGYKVRACDINPFAVAATRNNAKQWHFDVQVHEGGPGPLIDGNHTQWAGDTAHDVVVWNLPYITPESEMEHVLGPLEEAALLDTDQIGLIPRLMRHVRENQLIAKNGLILVLVSGNERGLGAEKSAHSFGFAARCVATHAFADGEQLRVVAIWNPYANASIKEFESIPSTNQSALQNASIEGDFFLAKHQTAGRGRRGRAWSSEAECFAGSWLIQNGTSELAPGLMQILGGYAILRTNQAFGVPREVMALKWPNDIFLHQEGKLGKVAGVLIEGTSKGKIGKVVMGIGINFQLAKQTEPPYPIADLSRWWSTKKATEYRKILHAIIASFFEKRDDIKSTNYLALIPSLEQEIIEAVEHLGEPIYRNLTWSIDGLTEAGNLRLINEQNQTAIIEDGEDLEWSNLRRI